MEEVIETLIRHYGFELRGYTAAEVVARWLETYDQNWVRLAVIEALYQGRYKAVSVEQILNCWSRLGRPHHRFNHDFESLICRKVPRNLENFRESLPHKPHTRLSNSTRQPTRPASVSLVPVSFSPIACDPTPADSDSLSSQTEEHSTSPLNNSFADSHGDRAELARQPIHQFTPPPDRSEFYSKLRAVAQQGSE